MKDQDRNDRESLEEIQAETTVSKNQTEQKQHKRRVRYKGTHPRSYRRNIRSFSRRNIRRRSRKSFKKEGLRSGCTFLSV